MRTKQTIMMIVLAVPGVAGPRQHLVPGSFLMARKMLKGIGARAETAASHSTLS